MTVIFERWKGDNSIQHILRLGAQSFLFIVLLVPAYAQFIDPSVSIGILGGGIVGHSDDMFNRQVDVQGRVFLRFGLGKHLQTEIGVGSGRLRGRDFSRQEEYKTLLIPIDVRVVFSPLLHESLNPYIYIGGGALSWEILSTARNTPLISQKAGWGAFIPAGMGLQIRLMENAALEVSGGYTYTLTDNLEALNIGRKNDAYWTLMGGIALVGESEDADPDRDSLTNRVEKQFGTDARKADTDGDKLSDGQEVNTYLTNPLKVDTDGDGLSDANEVFRYTTNPLTVDTDDDGLTDGGEITQYHTDPLKSDTDGDALSDSNEVLNTLSNPLAVDTDRDSLADGEEVIRYRTDPLKFDTDAGSVGDGVEIARGSDPLNPNDDVPKIELKVGKKIVLEGVTFRSGSAELTPESAVVLDLAFNTLIDNPEIYVEIQGHTDNRGKRSTNIRLSQRRADAVKAYLVGKGIESFRITAKGYGPDRPVAANTTEYGRSKNRRIEFFRLK